jgi:hypothetical protein
MWDDVINSFSSVLPLPLWVEHATLAFVIIGATMIFRRSTLCRLAVAVALLVSGAMLLDLVPQPSMAGFSIAGMTLPTASLQSVVMGQRQFAEIALLSLGSAWLLDELQALLQRRMAKARANHS